MAAVPQKIRQAKEKKALDAPNTGIVMRCQLRKPIWKVVAEIGEQIPLTTWEKVPDDSSINFKHYLYGESKRNT